MAADLHHQAGVRHRQQAQLLGHEGRQSLGGPLPGRRQRGGRGGQLGAQPGAGLAQLLDPVVGALELEQARRAPLRPREHLVDVVTVLAGEGGERGAALGDGRQPGRIGVDPVGVGGDVGGEVGEQVGHLGDPVGELPGLLVVLADPVEQAACGSGGRECVGGSLLAGEGLPRLLRRGAEGVGVAQAGLLGREPGVLPRLGRDRLDLLEAEAQQVGLLGPLAGAGHDLLQLGGGAGEPVVQVGHPRPQVGHLPTAEPV